MTAAVKGLEPDKAEKVFKKWIKDTGAKDFGGKTMFDLIGEARQQAGLPPKKLGLSYAKEKAAKSLEAAAYEAGAPNPGRINGEVPALHYDNPFGGKDLVRFDGIDADVLIDRKLSFYASDKAKLALQRQSAAISQNAGFKLRIEVPTAAERSRVRKYLTELDIHNIDVEVVGI
jgi:hypothetical protein